jgi:plastocyanin
MTTQYRLIHHGWTALTAALAVALAPALTRQSAAQGYHPAAQLSTLNSQLSTPGAAAAAKQQVNIDNFSFMPKTLTVTVGTTVTWTNHDDVPHTVVSTKKGFASPALDTDERFSFRFTAPGTYPYYCSVHPMMTGTVVVK